MKRSYLIRVIYNFILILGLTCLFPVMATTPDGETPAQENVCDSLLVDGVTPGLYGLCVAYCEAHDAELYNPEIACSTAESRILANYNRKKTATDPIMPCLKEPCPCWDLNDVEVFYTASSVSCTRGVGDIVNGEQCFSIALTTISDTDEVVSASIVDDSISGLGYCQFSENPRVDFEDVDQQSACRDTLEDIIVTRQLICRKKALKCKK